MSCIISDTAVGGALSPFVGATVVATATFSPLFQKLGGSFVENSRPVYTSTTDAAGAWSFTLPWPSECDPSAVQWTIETPDGYVWVGSVPEGVAGPVSLYTLKNTYGWGLVYTPKQTVTAIQGPSGQQKSPAPPTSGTWEQGSIVGNSNAASGQPMGWICTVAGSPGTWVALPNIP